MAKIWNKEKDTIKEIEFWDMKNSIEISQGMLFSGFETWEYNDDVEEMVIVENEHCLWSELVRYAKEIANELNTRREEEAFEVWTFKVQ